MTFYEEKFIMKNVLDQINLFELQKGNYFLHIISNTGSRTERIIVK